MLEKDTMIKVYNRSDGIVFYKVEDLNIRRTFESKETKEVSFDELQRVSYTKGGSVLLKDYLVIKNEEAVEKLIGAVEPEYYYTDKEIEYLLLEGSLDQLLDCLDFAPAGVIAGVKDMAIRLKINDVAKRKAIKEKTGFNVDKTIEINETIEAENGKKEEAPAKRRVSTVVNGADEAPKRKAEPVIIIKE